MTIIYVMPCLSYPRFIFLKTIRNMYFGNETFFMILNVYKCLVSQFGIFKTFILNFSNLNKKK